MRDSNFSLLFGICLGCLGAASTGCGDADPSVSRLPAVEDINGKKVPDPGKPEPPGATPPGATPPAPESPPAAPSGIENYSCSSVRSPYSPYFDVEYQEVKVQIDKSAADPVFKSASVGKVIGYQLNAPNTSETWVAPLLARCETYRKAQNLGVGFCSESTARFGVKIMEYGGGKIAKAYVHHDQPDTTAVIKTELTCVRQ